jgi:two-component system chemotaxis response regulator CheY
MACFAWSFVHCVMSSNNPIDKHLQELNILIADSNQYMRRITRTMLMNLGAKSVIESTDGLATLEMIRTSDPDVLLLDWDLPVLDGMEVMRIVRSPGVFPRPNLPIIMLTTRGERSLVVAALRGGAHEFLLKPTSPKALLDRLTSIVLNPRPMVKIGDYYVPEPRRMPMRNAAEAG